ncbi:MAG: hypothetical protein CSA24_02460 [Deltaproteobacteria bacterium]|nr:MAG: hypothetical protein CSB49_08550 [Pseudomonadota bacterium]PIE65581.1 MAG: hypothetical protein CSA24_02460 [Deltaproteobacteria bacterium]
MAIWVAIHPKKTHTRVLATAGARKTLLKAHLDAQPRHRRALPALLEALALWQGAPVRAALVADEQAATSGTSLYRDCLDLVESPPLFELEVGGERRRDDDRPPIRGLGDFRDVRQLALWEVAP